MHKKAILILSVLAYLLIINVLANININLNFNSNSEASSSSNNIGIGNSVTFEVKRPRLFYTIYETEGKSTLELFDIVPIPLKSHNVNLIYVHLAFIGITGYTWNRKPKRREK